MPVVIVTRGIAFALGDLVQDACPAGSLPRCTVMPSVASTLDMMFKGSGGVLHSFGLQKRQVG